MTTISTPVPDAPTGPIDAGAVRASSRFAALSQSITNVRGKRRGDERIAKIMRIVGALCLPIGIAAIITGWYGASHTGRIYEQNSYLISGGILGLALVFTGGFLYFSYWLTRQLEVARSAQQQNLEANRRMEERLLSLSTSVQALADAIDEQQTRPTSRR